MTVSTLGKMREGAETGQTQPGSEAAGPAGEVRSSEEAVPIDWEEVQWNERLILELPPDAEQEEVRLLTALLLCIFFLCIVDCK